MKLRNKRTGKIIEWEQPISYKVGKKYYSLAELSADWEDAPEDTKDFWYIRCGGAIKQNEDFSLEKHHVDKHKEIGNYFETKEETEKAVEKLKAWKRLKDAKFKFTDFGYNLDELSSSTISADGKICFEMICYEDFANDLELLFGGEE